MVLVVPEDHERQRRCYSSNLNGLLGVKDHGCTGTGYFSTWSGSAHGGNYSYRQGDYQQCLSAACTSHECPWIRIWVNGNGAWT
jgi:hypothetical protein